MHPWEIPLARTPYYIYRKRTSEGKKENHPGICRKSYFFPCSKDDKRKEKSAINHRVKDSRFRFFGALLQRGGRLKIKRSVHHVPHSGGYSTGVPPLPIPNREVKPGNADGTAHPRESR